MKSAFSKDVLRAATRSLGRFLAIAGIVALGAGFYAGLRMTAPDMKLSADLFYDGTSLMDMRVLSTLGLADGDLDVLRSVEGVEEVMGAYETDVLATVNGEQYATRVHSLPFAATASSCDDGVNVESDDPSYLNRLVLMEGSWPEREGECVMSGNVVMATPLSVGDTVTVTEGLRDVDDTLTTRTYTVTGLVSSSYYATSSNMGTTSLGSGNIQQFMYVPETDFSPDLPYTDAFVTVKGAAGKFYSSAAYDERVESVMDAVKAIAPARERARGDELRSAAQAALDDKRAEYESRKADTERELAEAKQQLAEAKQQLDDAASAIADTERELAQGQDEYDFGTSELAAQKESAQVRFSAAERQLAEAQAELDESASRLAQLKAALDAQGEAAPDALRSAYEEGKAAYDAGAAELQQQREAFAAARADAGSQMASAQQRLAGAAGQLEEGRAQLERGKADYEAGLADYEAGLADYEAARAEADAQLAEAKQQLEDAQQSVNDMEDPTYYVLDRSSNYGVTSFDADADRVDSIASVFPFIFFLVAALVALTTMTRMVEEERVLIGTYKALGYTRRRIASKYLLYALAASGAGAVAGITVLSQVLPVIIQKAYAIIYFVPQGPRPIDWGLAGLAAGMGVGVTLAATWAAAYATLRETPAQLMLPRAPKAGKRILLERVRPLWRRLSFSWKVTFRNLFRYKKRFVMTVVGIAGCTALLLTGLGLSNAINDIIDKQFGQITLYNTTVVTDGEADEQEEERLAELLDDACYVSGQTRVMKENMTAAGSDEAGSDDDVRMQVVVPQNTSDFGNFFTLRTRVGHEPVAFAPNGVILAEKVAARLGVQVGDVISLRDQDAIGNPTGEVRELAVTGIVENYIYNYVFIGPEAYEDSWEQEPEYTCVFAITTTDAQARAEFNDELSATGAVKTVTYNDETIDTYESMLSSVNMIVVVLVVAAAALAFIVLYNLTNINITERVREIATLKVLGFTPREVDAYIYREILLLSIAGSLAGLVLGVFMETFVVVSAEVDQVMFGREIHAESFMLAFLLTLLFAAFVMFAMRKKLAHVNMVESLKSNE